MSTWVFLRGLTREARHWGNFPKVFCDENPGADVVTPDLPGNGRLYDMSSAMRVEDTAEFCRQRLLASGILPPYRLLGLSLGGMVAVEWCRRHPDEVHALVLINSSLRLLSPFYQRLRPGCYWDLIRAALLSSNSETRERIILRLTSSHGDAQPELLKNWIRYRKQYPVSRRNALRQLIAAARYEASRRKPEAPVLLLASARDQLVNPQCSQQLADQWVVPLALHPAAGHDLPLDDGMWVARQVGNWIADPVPTPRSLAHHA